VYGSFVRTVRESRRLTQGQLAEISGIRQANISAIENGRRTPSADTLNRLLVACGYELAAVAGSRVIGCPLPKAGWFPDEERPEGLPDDPRDDAVSVDPSEGAGRAGLVMAVLDAVDAVMSHR